MFGPVTNGTTHALNRLAQALGYRAVGAGRAISRWTSENSTCENCRRRLEHAETSVAEAKLHMMLDDLEQLHGWLHVLNESEVSIVNGTRTINLTAPLPRVPPAERMDEMLAQQELQLTLGDAVSQVCLREYRSGNLSSLCQGEIPSGREDARHDDALSPTTFESVTGTLRNLRAQQFRAKQLDGESAIAQTEYSTAQGCLLDLSASSCEGEQFQPVERVRLAIALLHEKKQQSVIEWTQKAHELLAQLRFSYFDPSICASAHECPKLYSLGDGIMSDAILENLADAEQEINVMKRDAMTNLNQQVSHQNNRAFVFTMDSHPREFMQLRSTGTATFMVKEPPSFSAAGLWGAFLTDVRGFALPFPLDSMDHDGMAGVSIIKGPESGFTTEDGTKLHFVHAEKSFEYVWQVGGDEPCVGLDQMNRRALSCLECIKYSPYGSWRVTLPPSDWSTYNMSRVEQVRLVLEIAYYGPHDDSEELGGEPALGRLAMSGGCFLPPSPPPSAGSLLDASEAEKMAEEHSITYLYITLLAAAVAVAAVAYRRRVRAAHLPFALLVEQAVELGGRRALL